MITMTSDGQIAMTPEQKIKNMIIDLMRKWKEDISVPDITADNIDEIFSDLRENEEDYFQDAKNEIRQGTVETNITSEYSRHYESRSVASQALDGSWVGWTYWYGGGKHGQPDQVDWMEYAYDLSCEEEEKLIIVQTFTKKSSPTGD